MNGVDRTKKLLVVGIIILFVCVSVQSAFAINQKPSTNTMKKKDMSNVIEKESKGLFWGVYRDCTISGWHNGMYPDYVDKFALVIFGSFSSIEYIVLTGDKGKIVVNKIIGFCFSGRIEQWIPREEAKIHGRLLFCLYQPA